METRGKKRKVSWKKKGVSVATPATKRLARRGKPGKKPSAS